MKCPDLTKGYRATHRRKRPWVTSRRSDRDWSAQVAKLWQVPLDRSAPGASTHHQGVLWEGLNSLHTHPSPKGGQPTVPNRSEGFEPNSLPKPFGPGNCERPPQLGSGPLEVLLDHPRAPPEAQAGQNAMQIVSLGRAGHGVDGGSWGRWREPPTWRFHHLSP